MPGIQKSPGANRAGRTSRQRKYNAKLRFEEIARESLNYAQEIIEQVLPGGKWQSHEYLALNPNRNDHNKGSFKVNKQTGRWSDFATADGGGDLISLVAYVRDIKQSEAAIFIAENFLNGYETSKALHKSFTSKKRPDAWEYVSPIPTDAPGPETMHPKHGKPSEIYVYRNLHGHNSFFQHRFETEADKQFAPQTLWKHTSTGKLQWFWKAPPEPRLLYNLDQLAEKPDAPALVTEGEKAADAATRLFPHAIATTSLNGAKSPHKSDWLPLSGRRVWIWPDADVAGHKYAEQVAELVKDAGAADVREIRIEAFRGHPNDPKGHEHSLPDGFDAADAVANGWTAADVENLLLDPAFLMPPRAEHEAVRVKCEISQALIRSNIAAYAEERTRHEYFRVDDTGVLYIPLPEHGSDAPTPVWICSRLEITASVSDERNECWGRLLEFNDLSDNHHKWCMPMALLSGSGDEFRAALLSMGLLIAPGTKARNWLMTYVQTARPSRHARCVRQTGWHLINEENKK